MMGWLADKLFDGPVLMVIVTLLYIGTAVIYFRRGDLAHTLMFVGYIVANLGFIWHLW